MDPQLQALLAQAQSGGGQAQGPSPMVAAIQKMMGAGGSAPMPSQYNRGNQMLQDRSTAGQGAAEQSMRDEPDTRATTENELADAQKNMGVRDKQGNVPMPQPNRVRQMQNNPTRENDLPYEGNRRSGPTSRDRAIMDEIPTDGVLESAEKRFGLRGMNRR